MEDYRRKGVEKYGRLRESVRWVVREEEYGRERVCVCEGGGIGRILRVCNVHVTTGKEIV